MTDIIRDRTMIPEAWQPELAPAERKITAIEIAEQIAQLMELEATAANDEERTVVAEEIQRVLSVDFEKKVLGLIWVDGQKDAEKAQVEAEREVLKAYSDKLDRDKKRLRDIAWLAMTKLNMRSASYRGHSISISDGADSVDITDYALLPADYFHPPKPQTPAPDKEKIKRAIHAGTEVPGARLKRGEDKVTFR